MTVTLHKVPVKASAAHLRDAHLQIAFWYNRGYTGVMKTAISVPDPIFEKGEKIARKLGLSRSALYTRALEELVARHAELEGEDPVTAKINQLVAEQGPDSTKLDPAWKRLRSRALTRNDW